MRRRLFVYGTYIFLPSLKNNLVSNGDLPVMVAKLESEKIMLFWNLKTLGRLSEGSIDTRINMYMLPSPLCNSGDTVVAASSVSEAELRHQRLAHINHQDPANVHKISDDTPKFLSVQHICRAYQLRKAHRLRFSGHFKRDLRIKQIDNSDMWENLNFHIRIFIDMSAPLMTITPDKCFLSFLRTGVNLRMYSVKWRIT